VVSAPRLRQLSDSSVPNVQAAQNADGENNGIAGDLSSLVKSLGDVESAPAKLHKVFLQCHGAAMICTRPRQSQHTRASLSFGSECPRCRVCTVDVCCWGVAPRTARFAT